MKSHEMTVINSGGAVVTIIATVYTALKYSINIATKNCRKFFIKKRHPFAGYEYFDMQGVGLQKTLSPTHITSE